jgi:hypothetical protein
MLSVAVVPPFRTYAPLLRTIALAIVCLAAAPARAENAGWLYSVDVPVADQSPGARQGAARDGLAVVLSRLTGLARMPDDARIRSALASPDRYYSRFGYVAGAAPDTIAVRLQFSPPALFDLIRSTGLPIWPSARPAVRATLVLNDGAGPRFADPVADQLLVDALQARALERGIPLSVTGPYGAALQVDAPAMPGSSAPQATGDRPAESAVNAAAVDAPGADAVPSPGGAAAAPQTDAGAASTGEVGPTIVPELWDMPADELIEASPLAHGELGLIARVAHAAEGEWTARWELVGEPPAPEASPGATYSTGVPEGGATAGGATTAAAPAAGVPPGAATAVDPAAPVVFEARAATPEQLSALVVDGLVERLLGRYQVQAGDSRAVTVAVAGIASARAYARALAVFGGVEVIDDVAVLGADGDRVRFALTTMAALEQLRTLVTATGELVADPVQTTPAQTAANAQATAQAPTGDADLVLRWQER